MKCLINETLFFDTYIWLWWVGKILLAQKNRISDNGYCITCIKKEVFPIFLNIVQIFWIFEIYFQENISKAKAMIIALTNVDYSSVENAAEYSSSAESFLKKLVDQLM